MNLTEFLLARISEDEAEAVRSCGAAHPTEDIYCGPDGHPDPKRLAECEAKRAIVETRQLIDAHIRKIAVSNPDEARDLRSTRAGLDVALQALAMPYADHPDFDENWRP